MPDVVSFSSVESFVIMSEMRLTRLKGIQPKCRDVAITEIRP